MSDFNDTAQRLAPRLALPASHMTGTRRQRELVSEPGESAWAWTRFAVAGIVIAWLLSMGVFGAAAPEASAAAAPASAESGNGPTGYFPDLHRDAPLTAAEQPATF
ncbi:MAG TPA: hypothetical protein VJM14_09810 [Burkholderiales bacterium]|nr:hypothetical protein [Burkholderiales bacterium]